MIKKRLLSKLSASINYRPWEIKQPVEASPYSDKTDNPFPTHLVISLRVLKIDA